MTARKTPKVIGYMEMWKSRQEDSSIPKTSSQNGLYRPYPSKFLVFPQAVKSHPVTKLS